MSARINTHEVILYLTNQFLYIFRAQSFPIQAGQTVRCPAESHSSGGGTGRNLPEWHCRMGTGRLNRLTRHGRPSTSFGRPSTRPIFSTQLCHRTYPTGELQEDLPRPKGVSVHPGWRKRQGLARRNGYERHDFLPSLTLLAHFENGRNIYVCSSDCPRPSPSSVGLLPVEYWVYSKMVARGSNLWRGLPKPDAMSSD